MEFIFNLISNYIFPKCNSKCNYNKLPLELKLIIYKYTFIFCIYKTTDYNYHNYKLFLNINTETGILLRLENNIPVKIDDYNCIYYSVIDFKNKYTEPKKIHYEDRTILEYRIGKIGEYYFSEEYINLWGIKFYPEKKFNDIKSMFKDVIYEHKEFLEIKLSETNENN